MKNLGLRNVTRMLWRAWIAGACVAALCQAQDKRSRQSGLEETFSSSTAGDGNLHLTLFGRTFLWDNNAAQKIPPFMPHGELNYGVTDYCDVTAGFNAVSYVLQPGYSYLRIKASPMGNKDIRFFGIAGIVEAQHQMFNFFPSDGYRVKSEGFGPEGFLFGNDALITSLKALVAADFELIRLSSYLPFKLYLNAGWEGEFSSYIADDNAARAKALNAPAPDQAFDKIPLSAGLELKTYATDFFLETEAQPFLSNLIALQHGLDGWARYQVVGKTFDVSLWETPIYLNIGARMKYGNGLELQGGLSWLLSSDLGPTLGACEPAHNSCHDGATDGFSPFYPQWKVFGLVQYPLHFLQPSSELYRSFLLHRYEDRSKRVDLDRTLDKTDTTESDEQARRRRLEERRKEANAQAVDLN